MSLHLLSQIIQGENKGQILEAIDYANKQWKEILENNNYSEIPHLERRLEHMTDISTGKNLIFHTGIAQFYNDGFVDCNREEVRIVLKEMQGICSEIDSMIHNFRKDYNI